MSLPPWLADPELAPLWHALRERLERFGPQWRGALTLRDLTAPQQHALGLVLGRPVMGPRLKIRVSDVDERLRTAGGLVTVVSTAIGEPLRDRPAVREARRTSRIQLADSARGLLPVAPWVEAWVEDLRRLGPAVGVAMGSAHVLARLEAPRPTSRVDLAAESLGDAHGLDDGTPTTTWVLRGLAHRLGAPAPLSAGDRRALWHAAGVATDGISTTCLVRALPVTSDDRGLDARLAGGEPVHLTPRDVGGASLRARRGLVFVCENPRVLEAVADAQLDIAVVCGNGNPTLVVYDVLSMLRSAGCELRYHGDFDWPGLAIANRLISAVGATPWSMLTEDYLRGDGTIALAGVEQTAAWDATLTAAMTGRGVAVHEEAVLPDLLDQLSSWPHA